MKYNQMYATDANGLTFVVNQILSQYGRIPLGTSIPQPSSSTYYYAPSPTTSTTTAAPLPHYAYTQTISPGYVSELEDKIHNLEQALLTVMTYFINFEVWVRKNPVMQVSERIDQANGEQT